MFELLGANMECIDSSRPIVPSHEHETSRFSMSLPMDCILTNIAPKRPLPFALNRTMLLLQKAAAPRYIIPQLN